MKKLLAALTFLLAPVIAHADLINGGFETGNLTGWSSIGDVSVVNSSFGVAPPQGTFQVLISNAPGYDKGSNLANQVSFSGANAMAGGLIILFGASANDTPPDLYVGLTGAGPHEQSGIKQSFTTATPGVLTFRWNYLTDEGVAGGFFDQAVIVLDNTVLSLLPSPYLPWIGGSPASLSPSPSIFLDETGYQTSSILVAPGTHTLGFGIGEHPDPWIMSALLIDDISLTKVSEPASWLLLGLGLMGVARVGRRIA